MVQPRYECARMFCATQAARLQHAVALSAYGKQGTLADCFCAALGLYCTLCMVEHASLCRRVKAAQHLISQGMPYTLARTSLKQTGDYLMLDYLMLETLQPLLWCL